MADQRDGNRRRVYRSRRRILGAPFLGLATGVVWFLAPPPFKFIGFAATLLLFLAMGWWPRLITTPDEVIIWNLTRWRSPRSAVRRVVIADQLPELGLAWRLIHNLVGGARPYTGVVIETKDQGRLAAFALQSVSPFWNVGRDVPQWLATVCEQIDDDLRRR